LRRLGFHKPDRRDRRSFNFGAALLEEEETQRPQPLCPRLEELSPDLFRDGRTLAKALGLPGAFAAVRTLRISERLMDAHKIQDPVLSVLQQPGVVPALEVFEPETSHGRCQGLILVLTRPGTFSDLRTLNLLHVMFESVDEALVALGEAMGKSPEQVLPRLEGICVRDLSSAALRAIGDALRAPARQKVRRRVRPY
jgi:hypothetical protein